MATWLRQSTAIDVSIGPFVDNADGVTPETGLTITQPDIRLKKNGGAWAQKNAAQTLSHEENGWYEVALDATDTNTLGNLLIAVNESGALPVWREFQVVTANVWDSLFGADLLQVDVTQVSGVAQDIATATALTAVKAKTDSLTFTVAGHVDSNLLLWRGNTPDNTNAGRVDARITAIASGAITSASFGFDAINADVLAADAITEIANGVATSTAAAVAGVAVDGATTLAESLRLSNAALGGKLSGAGTGTEAVRDLADTKDRLIYTVDDQGNRTAVTRDLT